MAADASAASALSPVATDKAPAAIGPYSQAMCAGDTVYVSGCIGMVPGDSKAFAGDGVAEQAAQALANMAAILDAAGSSMQHVAKTTVLLTDMEHYAEVRACCTANALACRESMASSSPRRR